MSALSRRQHGFTLIELLVVIGIIAVLSAILFPVFAQAREKGRQASCSSNIRQVMLGAMQYNQDYDETFPPTFTYTSAGAAAWPQILYTYTKSTQIFRCPDDTDNSYANWLSSPAPGGMQAPFHTSYLANYQIGGSASTIYENNPGVSLATIQKPTSTVYLTDGGMQVTSSAPFVTATSSVKNGSWELVDPTTGAGCPVCAQQTQAGNYDWAGPNLRHMGMSLVGFADGHVKMMHADKWYYGNTPWLDPARGGE